MTEEDKEKDKTEELQVGDIFAKEGNAPTDAEYLTDVPEPDWEEEREPEDDDVPDDPEVSDG